MFFRMLMVLLILSLNSEVSANDALYNSTEGTIEMSELLDASKMLARSTSSKFVNKKLPGSVVKINGKPYEIRYFSFEDTSGVLPKNMTFSSYVQKNNLQELKSVGMEPLPGIHFESFDFRRVSLGDGVYFSLALREIGR